MEDASPGASRPVLYLDLDDTVVSWQGGSPQPAPGVRDFLLWALDRFEVRWLTSWAPNGRMAPRLVRDLSRLTGVPVARLREVRGLDWKGGSKVDGIAWVEHVILDRPFVWMEDRTLPEAALELLARHGYGHCFRRCDVTHDPDAVRRIHRELEARYGLPRIDAAAPDAA